MDEFHHLCKPAPGPGHLHDRAARDLLITCVVESPDLGSPGGLGRVLQGSKAAHMSRYLARNFMIARLKRTRKSDFPRS